MDFNQPEQLTRRLDSRERLIWWGRPKQGLLLRKGDYYLIPFSIVWAGFVIFWEFRAWDAPLFFRLWGIPFILAGVYLLVGRFFVDAWHRFRTYYGLTFSRVLIVGPSKTQSIELENLSEMTLEEFRDGTGTIILGHEPYVRRDRNDNNWDFAPPGPRLERITEAQRVYSEIRAQKQKLQK